MILSKVVVRTAKLALLSLMVSNANVTLNNLRISRVLMKFAVCYLFTSLIIIFTPNSSNTKFITNNKFSEKFKFISLYLNGLYIIVTIIAM